MVLVGSWRLPRTQHTLRLTGADLANNVRYVGPQPLRDANIPGPYAWETQIRPHPGTTHRHLNGSFADNVLYVQAGAAAILDVRVSTSGLWVERFV